MGGAVVFPDGYLKHAYAPREGRRRPCIADEVQSGFGRTGTHYWGFETQGVVPDIVTLAKSIGNGCPLAAVVTTPKSPRRWLPGSTSTPSAGTPWSAHRAGRARGHRPRGPAGQQPQDRRTPQGRLSAARRQAQPHRGRPRTGAHARHRARQGPGDEGARQGGVRGGLRALQGPRATRRQGRPVGEHAAHQASDVPHRGRRRFSARRPGRGAGGGLPDQGIFSTIPIFSAELALGNWSRLAPRMSLQRDRLP